MELDPLVVGEEEVLVRVLKANVDVRIVGIVSHIRSQFPVIHDLVRNVVHQ